MQQFKIALLTSLIHMCHGVEISEEKYTVLKGLKILKKYKTISLPYDGISLCALYCLTEKHLCRSANYNKITKSCELNLKSPLEESAVVVEEKDWKVIYINDDKWQLIFRGTAGIGVKVYSAYLGNIKLPPSEAGCHLPHILTCTTHYRHPMIDDWQSQHVKQVKFSMYKDGKLVVNLLFENLENDSNVRWFSKDRLLYSSFTDLADPQQQMNFFGIKGQDILERRFFINHAYNACAGDSGWMCIFDGELYCDYEKGYPYPNFAYMPNHAAGVWNDREFQSADVLAIFVQRG